MPTALGEQCRLSALPRVHSEPAVFGRDFRHIPFPLFNELRLDPLRDNTSLVCDCQQATHGRAASLAIL